VRVRLKVLIPTQVLVDREVGKIVAEALNGSFGMLPRHIDFATALTPGILLYVDDDGIERYLGVDEGILVKCAEEVLVSVRNAVAGDDLETLRHAVRERFLELDERESSARSALARLEAGVVRRFIELQEGR
jgi:F-type H+-transporting ATPase subunit epsilon